MALLPTLAGILRRLSSIEMNACLFLHGPSVSKIAECVKGLWDPLYDTAPKKVD